MSKNRKLVSLTNAGMLVAVSVVLTRLFSVPVTIAGIQAIRLNLGFIPIMLSSILLGPFYGGIVGAAADIAGYFVNSGGGAYFPGFTLTSALVGIIPYLICFRFKRRVFITALAVFTTTLISSLLNTLWLVILFNKSFSVLIIPRLVSAVIMCPIYTMFVHTLDNVLGKLVLKRTGC